MYRENDQYKSLVTFICFPLPGVEMGTEGGWSGVPGEWETRGKRCEDEQGSTEIRHQNTQYATRGRHQLICSACYTL